MAPFHPRAEDLPSEFPVFPLAGALLLPRGKLPLNIFEPRYKALVEDALGLGRMFGMIQPDATQPEGPNGPALFRIGCLGRLSAFSETDDGRYQVTLTGVIRFAVASESAGRRGYRRVLGDMAAFVDDLDLAPKPIKVERDILLTVLRGFFNHRGVEANWDAIKRLTDDNLVITLAMVCPFEPAEKQALLEAGTIGEQAEMLLTLLRMGAVGPDSSGGRAVS
jgi:Lon protease-like protein